MLWIHFVHSNSLNQATLFIVLRKWPRQVDERKSEVNKQLQIFMSFGSVQTKIRIMHLYYEHVIYINWLQFGYDVTLYVWYSKLLFFA